ncbi:hypothetical protein AB46_0332 [Escherichia coli 3-267-03_S1_C2]|nr:hypothetical protein AB46_0332 [Escherichia coli 3-267-03_S1_C2]
MRPLLSVFWRNFSVFGNQSRQNRKTGTTAGASSEGGGVL